MNVQKYKKKSGKCQLVILDASVAPSLHRSAWYSHCCFCCRHHQSPITSIPVCYCCLLSHFYTPSRILVLCTSVACVCVCQHPVNEKYCTMRLCLLPHTHTQTHIQAPDINCSFVKICKKTNNYICAWISSERSYCSRCSHSHNTYTQPNAKFLLNLRKVVGAFSSIRKRCSVIRCIRVHWKQCRIRNGPKKKRRCERNDRRVRCGLSWETWASFRSVSLGFCILMLPATSLYATNGHRSTRMPRRRWWGWW